MRSGPAPRAGLVGAGPDPTARGVPSVRSIASRSTTALMPGRMSFAPVPLALVIFVGLPLVFGSIPTSAQSAGSGVEVGPPPDWIATTDLATIVPSPDPETDRDTDGLHYVLVDRQTHAGEQVSYLRYRYRLTSEGGVQENSSVQAHFDPTFQNVVWHHLRIERGGVELDRLDPARFRILQQERQLDRHVYNGRLSQVCLLEDVRVGDTIDFAFSVHGANPVFQGRVTSSFSVGWSIPLDRLRERWLLPAGRSLQWKAHGLDLAPTRRPGPGDTEEWVWQRDAIPAIDFETGTPLWAATFPFVEIGEWAGWRDVIEWGVPLYPTDGELPDDWRERLDAVIQQHPDLRERAAVLLRLVQDEIRYLAVTLGEGSHRPSPVADVCARRFGDCKDKSVLLCTLLRAAGIEAWPALVETDWAARVDQRLPSPLAFDHVIVQLRIGGDTYTVDPTLSHQRGRLDRIYLPPYGRVLPLRPDARRLEELPPPLHSASRINCVEIFHSGLTYADPAALTVETRYEGRHADSIRRYFAETRREAIGRRYTEYYAQTYPRLEQLHPPDLFDDTVNNRVTVTERYRVPDFWAPIPGSDRRKATVGVSTLREVTSHPSPVVRTRPLSLIHPEERWHTVQVHLPEAWDAATESETIESPGFRFHFESKIWDQLATLTYYWRSLADHVAAADLAVHARQLAEVRQYLDYEFTTQIPSIGSFRLDWLSTLLFGSTLVIGVFWITRLLRDCGPPPLKPEPPLAGLGGWLILVGIGVVVAPLVQFAAVVLHAESYFSAANIAATADPLWENHHPWWPAVIRAELALKAVILVVSTAACLTFFRRQRQFPFLFIAVFAVSVAENGLQWFILENLPTVEGESRKETISDSIGLVLQGLIWVPYILVSQRVKLTFVR
jgi:transglutaminase-like putative cysteine protease